MNWQEVCEHPSLRDLPFKIELDEYGRVIMCPVKVYHSLLQVRIAVLLERLLQKGAALSECAISTSKGTKVADVAWASSEVLRIIKTEAEASVAPEICVEIISASNTAREMAEKRQLYFEAGAQEVWMCDEKGAMSFFNADYPLLHSVLVPQFPEKIDV
ncbi:Uma2 family endonuclease [Methylovulum psychrotolerans]|uniref:Uma2 family endonuclease n=1 Tax=Methylovulum psychrotolerans TaxID=1704499 RepID=UPI001BFF64CD|nr:Uma2 family endonuclease [Methylovulum psychrotolerans]MBT9096879.1 Uma2 family endonuclease [Methylovulum psychrotolerans]